LGSISQLGDEDAGHMPVSSSLKYNDKEVGIQLPPSWSTWNKWKLNQFNWHV